MYVYRAIEQVLGNKEGKSLLRLKIEIEKTMVLVQRCRIIAFFSF